MMAANRVMLSIRAKGNCRKHRGLVITARASNLGDNGSGQPR